MTRGRGEGETRRGGNAATGGALQVPVSPRLRVSVSPRPRVSASRLSVAFSCLRLESDVRRDLAQRGDDEIDVLAEVDAELLRAFVDFIAIDRAREGLVFELLLDRLRFQ